MSTRSTEQFENDLAQLLRAGGDAAPDLQFDVGAVIDQGHRAVRRARLVRGAAGLAAAAVIAVGGYAVLTGGVDRAGEFTPATPSPSAMPEIEYTSSPVRFSDSAESPSWNCSGSTPMPMRLERWMRSYDCAITARTPRSRVPLAAQSREDPEP